VKEVTLNLGIVGGCLTHQPGIPRSQLYQQLLATRLAELRIQLKVHISRGFEEDPADRIAALAGERDLDAVLLHVRSTFVRKAGIVATVVRQGVIRYYLHPFLFRPWKLGWNEVERRDFNGEILLMTRVAPARAQAESLADKGSVMAPSAYAKPPTGSKKLLGLSLRALIYRAGRVALLDRWMQRDELRQLQEAIDFCQKRRLPLLIMGPSHRPEESYLNRLCIGMDRKLAKWINPSSVRYCSLMTTVPEVPTGLYSPDGLHMNRAGHAHVARCLETMVGQLALEVRRTEMREHTERLTKLASS
jgi:hypothetical protein